MNLVRSTPSHGRLLPEFPALRRACARASDFGGVIGASPLKVVICGAKRRRDGEPCQAKSIPGKRRCKWHGGHSTGPKTVEGKARSLANLRRGTSR